MVTIETLAGNQIVVSNDDDTIFVEAIEDGADLSILLRLTGNQARVLASVLTVLSNGIE
jgi:hypothetical protein